MKSIWLKMWGMLVWPDETLQQVRDEPPLDTIKLLMIQTGWLALLTAVTNYFGFPCNLLNSGTNPQLFAYQDFAPLLVDKVGGEIWMWMAPLVFLLMLVFVPMVSLIYHGIFKLLRGQGGYWQTVRFFVYAGVPVFLLGWVPLAGGTLAAFWTVALYPLALVRLQRFSWGKAALFVGVLMGVQIGRIFLTGEWYGIPVR